MNSVEKWWKSLWVTLWKIREKVFTVLSEINKYGLVLWIKNGFHRVLVEFFTKFYTLKVGNFNLIGRGFYTFYT